MRIIELANVPSDLLRVSDLSMYSRRVRFRVREELEGSAGEEFELFTDATSCGYEFQVGREYLVVSHENKETGRWSTGACSRSAPVESVDAQQDLRALRARKAGETMTPRIYGQVIDPLPSALLRLAGASFHREALSDADGRFAFDNLPAGKYRLEVGGMEAWGAPQEIDLSGGGCFEAGGYC
ncbi:MAG: carboxypeptidase-like regulatory domain-containing protein [Acidobacteriota bacterium]|nr:carboxypeptidase-like regulatory domain-containing protein [Acidobacteriota bacterium]